MAKKILSLYCYRTLKSTKVNGVKIALRTRQTRNGLTDANGNEIPVNIFFYEVKASDGGYKKVFDLTAAQTIFEKMVEFEKKQTVISEE